MGKVLVNNLQEAIVTPDQVEEAVMPLLDSHVNDELPHPVYDNLASGRFITYLQNGMA